jgi:GH35 family endo-1,4-beta-xylanase
MNHTLYKHIAHIVLLIILTCFLNKISAGTSAEAYDYSHRKRDCEIALVSTGGEPLATTLIGIRQIGNDFAFGGTIRGEAFDTLGDDYGEQFQSYFDVATPENEMNWEYVMKCSQKCDADFSKADLLVDWLLGKKIPIRGHSLFSNEKEDEIPEWTRNLGTTAFKQAMQERINTTMVHFKGKIAQWDLINEICHGENGSVLTNGMLETKSGDPNVFSWIMDEAHKTDSVTDFIINDYNIITSSDQTAADQFINKVKPLNSKFKIVGAEGHFGANMNKSSYEPKINYLAQQLGKQVWLTDVDFSFDINQAPDKIEELMRTCFANPNIGGLNIGSWCRRYMPHNDLTNYFIDSLNNETPTGQRWREVRDEWKTIAVGSTDEFGKFKFNGFQGKYQILISCYADTFYLEPGEGTKTVEVTYLADKTAVENALTGLKTTEFIINGRSTHVKLPARYNRQLFLTTYSLSGQLLSRTPLNLTGGKHQITPASSCCRVLRIETADRQTLYTGKIMAVR